MEKRNLFSFNQAWVVITSLFIVGVAWGTLNARLDALESRMDSYENQTVLLLEELRRQTAEIKLEQAKMANDLEWIKKEISDPAED